MTDGRQASSALALPPLVLSFFWVASDPPVVLWCTVGSSCLFFLSQKKNLWLIDKICQVSEKASHRNILNL